MQEIETIIAEVLLVLEADCSSTSDLCLLATSYNYLHITCSDETASTVTV